MIDQHIKTLTSDILSTKKDRSIILEAIFLLKDAAYVKDLEKYLEKIKNTVPVKLFNVLEILVNKSQSSGELLENIAKFEKFINHIPVVSITIGYEPTKNQLDELIDKISSKVAIQVLVDYTIDNKLLGTKIEFDGKIYQKNLLQL